MKLSTKLEKVLNDQINLEFSSAYAYLGMAAYFEHTAFTGLGKWMELQSKEELGHANRFFKYIVERGGRIAREELARIDPIDVRQSRVFQPREDVPQGAVSGELP